mmetsp:Transcript_22368/g.39868  ORF Transcript_22368/g.39868 Transcript_22368/m.39868 type:complete len:200 (+) Transcript_22368:508-1107(+)
MREGVVELRSVFCKFPDQLLVASLRVLEQSNVGGEHHDARESSSGILDPPLPLVARALVQLPGEALQMLEVRVVPLGGVGGPRALKSRSVGVLPLSTATLAWPRASWVLLWRGPWPFRASSVSFAEGVAAADEGHGLAVVHAHPPEGVPDLPCAQPGDRVGHRPLRVDVDQADCVRPQRRLAVTIHGTGKEALLPGCRA